METKQVAAICKLVGIAVGVIAMVLLVSKNAGLVVMEAIGAGIYFAGQYIEKN